MRWSTRIGGVSGIGFYIHWTFWLLIVWLLAAHWLQGSTPAQTLQGIGLVAAIFGCVLLHELGHALAAKRYGVRTRDITLLPIGGVARLERIPENPRQELVISLAGPAVNLLIAAALFAVIELTQGFSAFTKWEWIGGGFLVKLMFVNVVLVAFNLLPAFPMDGGRVLRALLATRMDYVRATQIAAGVGQTMAILFAFLGFFVNWFLMFVGLFVYLGAQQEARAAQMKSLLRGIPVRDAMITRFRSLDAESSIATAVKELLEGDQRYFPLVSNGRVAGMISSSDIVAALSQGNADGRVGDIAHGECEVIDERESLDRTFERMQQQECRALPVARDGELVGIITLDNVGDWAMVRSAIRGDAGGARLPAGEPAARLTPATR